LGLHRICRGHQPTHAIDPTATFGPCHRHSHAPEGLVDFGKLSLKRGVPKPRGRTDKAVSTIIPIVFLSA
jgi:hypothetical protein